MECDFCGTRLRTSNVYKADTGARTHKAICATGNGGCGRIYTIVSVVVAEYTDGGPSAYTFAQRVRAKTYKVIGQTLRDLL